jgi:hypothetical protein
VEELTNCKIHSENIIKQLDAQVSSKVDALENKEKEIDNMTILNENLEVQMKQIIQSKEVA